MREMIMKKNYAKAFKTALLLAILLPAINAVAIPLSLSQQIRDISALEQGKQEPMTMEGNAYGEHHIDREKLWKSQVTPLTAGSYAILGGIAVTWLTLLAYYWLLVMAWLYKNAVNEGMNKSLWPILGLFTNWLAIFLFLIIRDDPRRAKPQIVQ